MPINSFLRLCNISVLFFYAIQFLADEKTNTHNWRVSSALLREEVINSCGTEGISATIESAEKRLKEPQKEKITGITGWWRVREATVFAFSSVKVATCNRSFWKLWWYSKNDFGENSCRTHCNRV
ncbi:unnamed protein product [Cuscuta epithymum]|uniref:Uncharacterized protein n=1 Tax=Cuscuta epithymum TaxID=186058 RepID=A0AAV0GAA4_9ASTE|nr:unnamed protein product [Cuscuta epithymum]CAH9144716.1 unnamed protein product [Cuscuta epithymum]